MEYALYFYLHCSLKKTGQKSLGKQKTKKNFFNILWFNFWHIRFTVCVLLLQGNFIEYLLSGSKQLTPQYALANDEIISHIINCSSAILLLSMRKCDLEINPNPQVSSKGCTTDTAKGVKSYFFSLSECDVAFFSFCSLCLKMSLRSFAKSHCC